MKPTKPTDWSSLLLLIAILFGALVRFMPAFVTRFPINDGGMFLDMTRDLQANHYLLPATTSYNGLNLPYAYPPFGFYAASLLADLTRAPLIEIFLWLPAFVSLLVIPAFYLLARSLLADNLRAALATLFFALTPGIYFWPIMGGGVTRSFGILFMVLAIFAVLRLFQTGAWKWLSLSIIFCSLAVLSHPEVAIQTAGACFVIWLFHGRTWRGALHAFPVALGVLLLTAPWWGTVISRHGLAPFLSALQTGQHASVSWLSLVGSLFTTSELIPFLLLLQLAGLTYALWKRQFILIALIFVSALVDPRSAGAVSLLAMSMLSALGFLDALPALLQKLRRVEIRPVLEYRSGIITLFILTFFLFIECGLTNFRLINTTLTSGDRAAMQWVHDNQYFYPGTDFVIVTGKPYSMSDPVQEWFPTLTGQHSQSTLQGLEWTLGGKFNARLNDLTALQACADVTCVEAWSVRTGLRFDVIWITNLSASANPKQNAQTGKLIDSLKASGDYFLIYKELHDSERIVIFSRIYSME